MAITMIVQTTPISALLPHSDAPEVPPVVWTVVTSVRGSVTRWVAEQTAP
jgi:hypothetical protein